MIHRGAAQGEGQEVAGLADAVVIPMTRDRPDGPRGPWLRSLAAFGFLYAGIIHLAQVASHLDEDVRFGAFFLILGGLQVTAAIALVRARRPAWYRLGIMGSIATIAIWLLSRSLGLPFGAEPGSVETVGMADAAASLLEGITVVALILWLRDRKPGERSRNYAAAAGAISAMGVVWFVARRTGLFDPDFRLTGAPPELADQAAFVAVLAAVLTVIALSRLPVRRPGWIHGPLVRGLLLVVFASAAALTILTLPARGGQNAGCLYGPLSEASGLSHAEAPEPVEIEPGEVRTVPVLLLSVCGTEPLMLTAADRLNSAGVVETLLGFGVTEPSAGGSTGSAYVDLLGTPSGALLRPGELRLLVAQVRGERAGSFRLDSVRLQLLGPAGEADMTFATYLGICTRPCLSSESP